MAALRGNCRRNASFAPRGRHTRLWFFRRRPAMPYIYMVQMDIPEAMDAELNRIYDAEHVPMLSKVPGVHKVTRYRLEQSNDSRMQKYMAIYEIDSPAVVSSKEWEEAG